jgi:hypothetical protein
MCCVCRAQDFAAPPGIPGVGTSSGANSLVHYGQGHQHSASSSSGLLLDPSLPPDTLAVTLAAKRAALMERESALQVGETRWVGFGLFQLITIIQ